METTMNTFEPIWVVRDGYGDLEEFGSYDEALAAAKMSAGGGKEGIVIVFSPVCAFELTRSVVQLEPASPPDKPSKP